MNRIQFWTRKHTAVLRVEQLMAGPNACKHRVISIDPERAHQSYAPAKGALLWATPQETKGAAEAQLRAYAEKNALEPYVPEASHVDL